MISYITASHNPQILNSNLAATVQLIGADELVVVNDPPSIAVAYNDGTARAKNRIRCYVHHDVSILNPIKLRAELIEHCREAVGVVGVIGSLSSSVPWWQGDGMIGSVVDARGKIVLDERGGYCAYMDGLLLATAHEVEWDESYDGFHLYDHDICQQMLSRGLPNYCLANGRKLVIHNSRGPTEMDHIEGWDEAVEVFAKKWAAVPG